MMRGSARASSMPSTKRYLDDLSTKIYLLQILTTNNFYRNNYGTIVALVVVNIVVVTVDIQLDGVVEASGQRFVNPN